MSDKTRCHRCGSPTRVEVAADHQKYSPTCEWSPGDALYFCTGPRETGCGSPVYPVRIEHVKVEEKTC